MKKLDQKKGLSATVSMLTTLAVCHVATTQASDIDIYSNSTGGLTRIMFVLDTSQSMSVNYDSGRNLNMACDAPPNVTVTNNNRSQPISASTVGGISIPAYTRRYCLIRNSAGQTIEINDRFTKLREGMFDVLIGRNGSARLDDNIIVGLTTFNNNSSGIVLSTARRLDSTTSDCTGKNQRSCLVDQIARMQPDDYTPTGVAYAIGAKSLLATIGTDTSTCNGNGIYVLTDGGPSGTNLVAANSTAGAMSQAITGFTCPTAWNVDATNTNPTFQFKAKTGNAENEYAWRCIAKFSDTLLKGATNRAKIKTATVGFGSFYEGLDDYTNDEKNKAAGTPLSSTNIDIQNILSRYNTITNDYANVSGGSSRADIANTALWGVYGRGGWYAASQPAQVAASILKFVEQVKPEFDPVATGSPTLPQDALNPLRIQPYGYYASFTPKPQESTQLWVGNMNKYHIYNGELYNNSKTIRLIKADGSLDSTAEGLWTNGMKGQLPLGIGTNAVNEQVANRTIYTNREITGTAAPYAASEIGSLKKVNVTTLFGTDSSTALFANDPDKNYWLNLLGYNVATTGTVTLADLVTKPELRQVGAVMHSTPLLLTQSGKITYSSNTIDTTDRDDYLLFGSAQGLLHVVDADTGVEKFAFAPNEMMQNPNQKAAFLSETSSTLGKNNLFYGIDAPWTAYTQYVSKADGTLTVKSSDRTSDGGTNTDLALKGLQWVYGGLRMGGRSYYALDLSDLGNPSLKFHIDPENQKIYNSATTKSDVTALSYMGQSWSKPTLAYVNFGGKKKLVMFVGGGYDVGYENAAYNQANNIGAGVYMFDANNGDLLWWTSANATAEMGAEAYTNASAASINMKYSVVSQINAIDRDSDGLVDNLYFGDLGGQGFRVDLNNAATGDDASAKKANFAKRVVRLFSQNVSGGVSPRFYEMPSFSIHESDNGYVAAVAFSSGNRSSPLVGAAVANGNQAGSVVSASDGVFVVYDKDVAKTNLYATSPAPTLTTNNVSLASLNTNIGTGIAVATNNGWKYTYNNTAGVYKGMNELYALDGMLYVNVFHRDGIGIGGSCGAGVKGDSYIYQFCLPTGKCNFDTTTSGAPNRVKVGAGILGSGLGQGFSNAKNTGLIVKRPDSLDCTTVANKHTPECQEFTTKPKLRQLRWYETR